MVHSTPIVDTVDCDFLIVGAGSSGCVLASRLVRAGLKVLVVEKGPADSPTLQKLVGRPSAWIRQATKGTGLSEAFLTVPQPSLSKRYIPAYRGRGGGGTSNINAGLYQRGREEDYKEWPWELKDIEASFKSVEAELTLEQVKPTGLIGPLFHRMLEEIGFEPPPPPPSATGGRNNSTTNVASRGSNIEDFTEPTWTKEGIGGCPMKRTTTNDGERQTAWAAFVHPVLTMPNLKVKDDSEVSRIIIEGGRAVGIEIVTPARRRWWGGGGDKQVRQLRLAKERAEIFVCCGAFRSPKLLMLSGVGPTEHLKEKGVTVVADMPHVGNNLQDHVLLVSMSLSKPQLTAADITESSIHGIVYFSSAIPPPPPPLSNAAETGPPSVSANADEGGSGSGLVDASLSSTSTSATATAVIGFMYTDGASFSEDFVSSLRLLVTRQGFVGAALRVAVLSLGWIAIWVTPLLRILRERCRGVTMLLTTVKSRGTVRLASGTDISKPPLIDPGYFSHPQDQRALWECWRTLTKAKRETAAGKASFGSDLLPGKMYNDGEDEESFLRFARDNCLPYFHPVGTCRMGRSREDSVVSAEDLRVHGISGLRMADASIVTHIPTTPTQAMCMMIGDRAAAMALTDRFAKDQVQARMLEAASSSAN